VGLSRLIEFTRRRWTLPIVAALYRDQGSRFAALVHEVEKASGAADGGPTPATASVRESLDHLIALGLAARNPGYGHPLRPEYILTDDGLAIGAACAEVDATVRRVSGLGAVLYRRWSLPIVRVIGDGDGARFGEIRDTLRDAGGASVTDRAVSLALTSLRTGGVVERIVEADTGPIRGVYAPAAWIRPQTLCLAQI
jgi:DNA-binding HxlR family transcriptional regulator